MKENNDSKKNKNFDQEVAPYKDIGNNLGSIRENISKEKKIAEEMASLLESVNKTERLEERKMILSNIVSLKEPLKKIGENVTRTLEKTNFIKPLYPQKASLQKKEIKGEEGEKILDGKELSKKVILSNLELETLKRIKRREEKIIHKKIKKPSVYVKIANKFFSKFAISLLEKGRFKTIELDLIKANIPLVPMGYISVIMFTTLISFFASILIFLFFLFFSVSLAPIGITAVTEGILMRAVKIFWIMIVIPLGVYSLLYFYPSMEKKSTESKINQELPFATINMAAISGSMIDPTKMFSIIASTKEYPYLEKEFTKLMNEINIYGYDLISALRKSALYCPSAKLADLYNGLAITINSGGDFAEFFDKRSQSLLFDYKLEKEKSAKAAETFMDLYISIVIAAPMILMLLVMMMKISGLGIALSTNMITLTVVLGVSVLNIVFLTFLYIKQPNE